MKIIKNILFSLLGFVFFVILILASLHGVLYLFCSVPWSCGVETSLIFGVVPLVITAIVTIFFIKILITYSQRRYNQEISTADSLSSSKPYNKKTKVALLVFSAVFVPALFLFWMLVSSIYSIYYPFFLWTSVYYPAVSLSVFFGFLGITFYLNKR